VSLVKGTNCGFVSAAPTTDPANSGAVVDGACRALKDVAPAGAVKVTEIGWWSSNDSEEANYEVAIYNHNSGDDNPEAVVGWDKTNAKGTTEGWKRCTGLNIAITPATTYWLALQVDNTATTTRIEYLADGGEKQDLNNGKTALDDPWGVSVYTDTYLIGIYAVYETGGGQSVLDYERGARGVGRGVCRGAA